MGTELIRRVTIGIDNDVDLKCRLKVSTYYVYFCTKQPWGKIENCTFGIPSKHGPNICSI